MKEYQNLLDYDETKAQPLVQLQKKTKAKQAQQKQRGCQVCPMNDVPGVNKVKNLDKVTGRKMMLWARNPGADENEAGRELVGRSGKWLWKELERVGLKREDFDIQNVVRCATRIETEYGETDRAPTKEEIRCCSVYTEEAIERNKGNARVHLVLGLDAAKALLGREFRKDQQTFYSETLKGHVVCVPHPAYFLRGGKRSKLDEFRKGLQAVVERAKETGGRWAYLYAQDYKEVKAAELGTLDKVLQECKQKGIRVSADLEDGWKGEENIPLCLGFSWRKGLARVLVLDHPEGTDTPIGRVTKRKFLKKWLEDPELKKVMQHGSYDQDQVWQLLDTWIRGYDYDTQYAEYLCDSSHRSYGLEAMADRKFRDFAGYKAILDPWRDENGKVNLAQVPLKTLIAYNGADDDLTKRIEIETRDRVPMALLRVFIDVAFVLDKMEETGPWFDEKHYQLLESWIPQRMQWLVGEIRKIAKWRELNPGSPQQISKVIYQQLKLQRFLDPEVAADYGTSTSEEVMRQLAKYHGFPDLVLEYRSLQKKKSTYMEGYKRSADLHAGRLRTTWWLTGTVTGRLRSGSEKDKTKGIVNLQNIHGDPTIECMLVSDPRWRELYRAWLKKATGLELVQQFGELEIFLAADHSQLEIRILAQMSRDKLLLELLLKGEDIHSEVGSVLTGWPVEKIRKDRDTRTTVKGIIFGIIYGLSAEALYWTLKVEAEKKKQEFKMSKDRVRQLYDNFFLKFKGVARFIETQVAKAQEMGWVQTLFGFKREVSQFGDEERKTFWKNQAVNSPIQGSAHQLLEISMSEMHRKQKTYSLLQKQAMEVHDSLVPYVQLRDLPPAYRQFSHLLGPATLNRVKKDWPELDWQVPLKVDAKAGFRWGVLVEDYKGGPPEELVIRWCEKNQEFEKGMREKMARDKDVQ